MPLRHLLFLSFLLSLHAMGNDASGAGDVTQNRVLDESADGVNWFLKGGNFRGEHFSPLTEIDTGNVSDLGLAWSAELPVPDGVSGTPIVVDGVIYLSGAFSMAFAVNAADGSLLWSYDPDVRKAFEKWPDLSWPARVNRGVAVWDEKVFVTTADCRLLALGAEKGELLWSQQTCDPESGYAITDSPYVGGGKVYVGNAGSESGEKNRGYVSAYDANDGEQVWRFYTVPSDNAEENASPAMKMAEKTWSGTALTEFGGGGSAWNEMTYDPDTNLLYFGTAGALPYIHSKRSPDGGINLFLSSIIAVNAGTGEYVWHYQTVPKDSWEYNATMNIILADVNFNDEDREVLLIAPKNGFMYALDKHTGELLAAEKYAKVNWAKRINLETGEPEYDPEGEYWTRPEETVAIWPNMWGAHSWNPMAYDPRQRLVYVPVVDVPSVVKYWDGDDFDETLEKFTEVDGRPFDPGKLIAFDLDEQEIRWSVGHDYPFNGGVLATAGDLVFQGNAEGEFAAYESSSGEKLWSVPTGSAITAAPVSYELDGDQYVLIPVGAGGGVQFVYPELHSLTEAQGPTRLLAFRLDTGSRMPDTTAMQRDLPPQPPLAASAETIAEGGELYGYTCGGCHGKNAQARFGGSVPDLRYANELTHRDWDGIVIGGARRANGMPAFELDSEQSQSVRAYVLSLSEQLRAD